MIAIAISVPRTKKGRRSLRDIASAVAVLQVADSLIMHANRDECLPCLVKGTVFQRHAQKQVPARLLRDKDWMHRHVFMPGARIRARLDLERAAS